MLFTGKSDDQRQGITPSQSDVSWKIPLFHRKEGKVQRTLEMVGMTTGTFVRKGGELTEYLSKAFLPARDTGIHRNPKNAKKQGHTCSIFYYLCAINMCVLNLLNH